MSLPAGLVDPLGLGTSERLSTSALPEGDYFSAVLGNSVIVSILGFHCAPARVKASVAPVT